MFKAYFLTTVLLLGSMDAFAADAQPKPKYGPKATPLSARSNIRYFQKNPAPDYWALSPYYLPQETGSGCSAANLAMILNAARVGVPLTSDDELITFKSFAEKLTDTEYRDAILGKVLTSGENFSNKNLTRLLNEASLKLKIPGAQPHADFVQVDLKNLKDGKRKFLAALKQNEKSANDFIFFSFVQGRLTGDPEGKAHVATVGAFDEKKGLVLVMDPDRQWYEPYWTPVDDLFESISDPSSDSRKEAGWIYFQVRPDTHSAPKSGQKRAS